MSGRVHAEAQAAPKSSFSPVQTGLLAGSRGKPLVLQPPLVQAKLTINQPNDRYEQEADRVAEQVMQMPETQVQRQVEPEEEEEEMLQTKPLAAQITSLIQRQIEPEEEEEELIQTKQVGGQTSQLGLSMESGINALRSGGEPLDPTTRAFMEPRFGHDFSRVRVHTDESVADSARTINARAFTIGHDVMFGAGQYAPETADGKRLLAHELVHTMQQNGNRIVDQRHPGVIIQRNPGPWRYKPPKSVTRSIEEIQTVVGTTPDGIYGPRTRDAVKEYQKKLNAKSLYSKKIDGKWGKYTEAGHVDHATGSEAETYNCSGLAFKTFTIHGLSDTESKLLGMVKLSSCSDKCKKFQYKFWYWNYDVSLTDLHTGITSSTHNDFHIVGGQTNSKGEGPNMVVSKNGRRPVKGPAPPASWRPTTALARRNDHTDTILPQYRKNRTNHVETCYCADSLP